MKNPLKNPSGYYIIQENRTQERGKGGGTAFIFMDEILIQKIKLKTTDRHPEVQSTSLTAGINNIKLVNICIPVPFSCDA